MTRVKDLSQEDLRAYHRAAYQRRMERLRQDPEKLKAFRAYHAARRRAYLRRRREAREEK